MQKEEQRKGDHLLGSSVVAHPMARLQGGVNGQFYDRPLQKIAWDRDSN